MSSAHSNTFWIFSWRNCFTGNLADLGGLSYLYRIRIWYPYITVLQVSCFKDSNSSSDKPFSSHVKFRVRELQYLYLWKQLFDSLQKPWHDDKMTWWQKWQFTILGFLIRHIITWWPGRASAPGTLSWLVPVWSISALIWSLWWTYKIINLLITHEKHAIT